MEENQETPNEQTEVPTEETKQQKKVQEKNFAIARNKALDTLEQLHFAIDEIAKELETNQKPTIDQIQSFEDHYLLAVKSLEDVRKMP